MWNDKLINIDYFKSREKKNYFKFYVGTNDIMILYFSINYKLIFPLQEKKIIKAVFLR